MYEANQTKGRNAILFDLDNTLWDHARAESEAIKKICGEYRIDFELFYPHYCRYNREVWRAYAKRTLSLSRMRVERFARTINTLGLPHLSPLSLSNEYLNLYRIEHYLIPGTIKVLQELKSKHIIGIITNGTRDIQKRKLERSGLERYINFMVTVDDVGYSKPDNRFFYYAFKRANLPRENILCIGDDFLDDIVGAKNAGAGTVIWFNPSRQSLPLEYNVEPDYIVQELHDVLEIIG